MTVLQEANKQSVRLSAGKQQLRNAEKGCSSIAHNIVMKAVGPGAAALSGTDWTDAVSDAYKAEVIYFLSLQKNTWWKSPEGQEEIGRRQIQVIHCKPVAAYLI